MTRQIVFVTPETSIPDMARLMLKNRISGLPVINDSGNLVSSSPRAIDCVETDTEPRRRRWVEFLMGTGSARERICLHAWRQGLRGADT
jgi:predicted transcriptional regulator